MLFLSTEEFAVEIVVVVAVIIDREVAACGRKSSAVLIRVVACAELLLVNLVFSLVDSKEVVEKITLLSEVNISLVDSLIEVHSRVVVK